MKLAKSSIGATITAVPLTTSQDIRTVQEQFGRGDVKTTAAYKHVLNPGGRAVLSPYS